MKNIAIDIRYLEKDRTGIAVGLKAILLQLDRLRPDYCFHLLCRQPEQSEFAGSDYFRLNRFDAEIFSAKEQILLPLLLKKHKIDLLYEHQFIVPFLKTCRIVTYLHDFIPLLFPGYYSRLKEFYYLYMNRLAVKRSDVLLVNSENTRKDLIKLFKPEQPVIVNHYAHSPEKLEMIDNGILSSLDLIKNGYYLFVSSLKSHKNHPFLIESFLKSNLTDKLVIVGRKNADCTASDPRLIFTDFISDSELNSLYRNSLALAVPTLYEGFGIFVLEAQFLGCPVITSNLSSLPEVAGAGAILVNPRSREELIHAMGKVKNEECRAELIRKGLENLTRFSWDRHLKTLLGVFEKLLED
ncbi:MAG: glycosyltransferase family 1 protein [Candidatus Wallbacteria bacterium]|nr:glycosyltransferase family 1 protein [Candidatus Wallbacteria bacterium]